MLRSPILTLHHQILAAPYRIAPEREDELVTIVDQFDLTVTINEGANFDFWVGTTSHEITTNIASLEFLWASFHAHLVLFDEYGKTQRSGEKQFDTGGNKRCKDALDLLSWSVHNLNSKGDDKWPVHLPMPVEAPEHGSDIHVTNEIFLCGVAWIMHHEIAHVRLGHTPVHTNRSQSEEFDADLDATKWVLDHSSVPEESMKRTFGIATAILAMMGIEKDTEFSVNHSHPAAFQRIFKCLDSIRIDENNSVFAFCSVIMQIQLWYSGKNASHEGTSHKDAFCSYLVEYARK